MSINSPSPWNRSNETKRKKKRIIRKVENTFGASIPIDRTAAAAK
jgi:hypothetical protein